MRTLNLTVVTPEKRIVQDESIEELVVPGFRGQLNILPGHAPLMTTLGAGSLKFRRKGSPLWESVAIAWGYCEVFPGGVSVLAENAELESEIDVERAEKELHSAWLELKSPGLDSKQREKIQRKIQREEARVAVARAQKPSKTH